ncbi:MAG: TlpA family protein disulfide reductase [Flavobacteriaceae bacterium]|nr:TlpA family protein disulfide reductase [Flavobacteriaceae bacterium]
MKKIFFVIIALSIISCSKEEDQVKYVLFSGKIENIDGGKLSVRNSEKEIKEITVLENGTFSDTIHNLDTGYYTFKYGNETSAFYLKPGYNLQLKLDTKEFDESVNYLGNGSEENNYLAQVYLNKEALGKLNSYQYLGTLDEAEYVSKMDSLKVLHTDYLNKQQNLDRDFKALEQASITYGWAANLQLHEPYKRYISKDQTYNASDNFYAFEKDLNLEDENLLQIPTYKRYITTYYRQKGSELAKEKDIEDDIALLNVVSKEVKSPKIKEFLLFGAAKYGISYTSDLQKYFDTFMASSTDEAHKKDITDKYNKLIKLSKGKLSPKFTVYENFKGGTTSLDDLKGKYVYIDVWATWCGPCIAEIPALKSTEEKYRNKNIAFVSMSIDKKKDYDKWRTMVVEKELSGIQLFAPNDWKSDFVSDYGIMGIPRFILIDPEGNIVNANAPRPSSDKLIETFNDLEI